MEAFGQLAGGIAHDFNNLLTVIVGSSDMLLEQELSPSQKDFVVSIKESGARAASLTRQLLAFSRKQLLTPSVVDLNTIVLSVEKLLRRLIGEDIEFNTQLAPMIGAVRVDRGQMEQVLLNLAVNARDAMPTGGMITIETTVVDWTEAERLPDGDWKPGRYVMLSISDTGCGMTPEVRKKIFEPFFTTKPAGRGTGLGLATVFGIVKQSDGYISVDSEVNVGTEFKIYLPAISPGSLPSATNAALVETPHGGSEAILVVDDEVRVREMASLILTSKGYRVVTADSGDTALELVSRSPHRFDLVVTDVVMPRMNGRQLVEALRERLPDVRVLYVSGYTDDAVVRHGIFEAKEAFLQKPFSPYSLAKRVREALDARTGD